MRAAKRHDADALHRLRSIPGVGKVLSLTILYEVGDIARFDRVQQFASYCRLVKPQRSSAGKLQGQRCRQQVASLEIRGFPAKRADRHQST